MEAHTRTIAKLIEQAEHYIDHHDWDEAAVRCYQILALDGENVNAQNKLRLIYLQRDLVDDMRNAVERLSDPDDASPHQYRRRLAFSYRVLSRWEGWLEDDLEQTPVDDLEEVLGFPQILETMGPHFAQTHSSWKVRGSEDLNGLRQQNLAPVSGGADAGRTMNI